MTDKQPEALRLAEMMEDGRWQGMNDLLAAAELRRLHEVNAELMEALKALAYFCKAEAENDGCINWYAVNKDEGEKARAALRKAQGENDE